MKTMRYKQKGITLWCCLISLTTPVLGAPKAKNTAKRHKQAIVETASKAVLWRDPAGIASRNLFYGPGGERHVPPTTFTFVKEDFKGSNPKFVVRDRYGVRWKVKLGPEARPETVASRLVWAIGYFANEDYFLPELRVEGLPPHLHRGQKYIRAGGIVRNARLKRYLKDEKKIGYWRWRHNPFSGTRELNGLRVMMALINNWDLKDDNTSVYLERQARGSGAPLRIYMVSDLGSSFGTTGQSWTDAKTKGNLGSYRHSRFISKLTRGYVDF
ncbi:MAG: hypothetical protein ACRD3O_11610, partial [Terriglobia bacterium]